MTELSQVLTGLRDAVASLDGRIGLLEGRIGTLEARMDARFLAADQKLDASVSTIRKDMASDFRWLVGIQVTTLMAIVASLLGTAAMR